MKIIITGITSELMQKLVALIDCKKHEVLGISRSPERIKNSHIQLVKGDICDSNQFQTIFEGCDLIIHAAAVTHSFKEKAYYQVNLEATKELIELSKKYNVGKFIFISSNTAGKESGGYGKSKLLAENYIKENIDSWKIFRPSEVYGGSKNEGIEELITNVMNKPFVFCPQNVPTKFSPIHIDDVTNILYENIFDSDIMNSVELISGNEEFTFLELINQIKNGSNSNCKIIFLKKNWMFAIKKISKILPFYIGVLPDQIERLYSVKHYLKPRDVNLRKIETYITSLMDAN